MRHYIKTFLLKNPIFMLPADFIIVVSHIKIRPAVHLRWPVGLKLIRPEQQKHNFPPLF